MKSDTGLSTSSQVPHPFASGKRAESSVASLLLLFQIKPASLGFDLIFIGMDDAHNLSCAEVLGDYHHQGNPYEGSQRKKQPPLGQVTEVSAVH